MRPLIFAILALVLPIPMVFAQHIPCNIDVFGLTVSGNEISANIKNTGTYDDQVVEYTFYINNEPVEYDEIILDAGEDREVLFSYPFGTGSFDVGIAVSSECGAWDSDVMKHTVLETYSCRNPFAMEGQDRCDPSTQSYYQCLNGVWELISENEDYYCYQCNACGDGVINCGETIETCPVDYYRTPRREECTAGFLMNYRCEENILQREFQYRDCTRNWVSIKYCEYGCAAGLCLPEPREELEEPEEICGISIDVDYDTNVAISETNIVRVTVENIANIREDVDVYFYVDGLRADRRSFSLEGNSRTDLIFFYSIDAPGTHNLKVSAIASRDSCSEGDIVVFRVNATESAEFPPDILTVMDFTLEEEEEEWETSVRIYPSEIDAVIYSGSIIKIEIEAGFPQTFYIDVSGVPEEWLHYRDEIDVRRSKTVYIYLTPKKLGRYTIDVEVTTEDEIFDSSISLFVAKDEKPRFFQFPFAIGNFELIVSVLIIIFILMILGVRLKIKALPPQSKP